MPKGTVIHALRHSYATHVLDEGVSIRLISAYLGHARIETTLIYLHLTVVYEASARDAIARIMPAQRRSLLAITRCRTPALEHFK